MKLEDIKVPDGYTVVGFDYPLEGDYVLTVHGDAMKVTPEDLAFNYPAIILRYTAWKPEIGKYYEFSDLADFTCITSLGLYTGYETDAYGRVQYYNNKGTGWLFIRPVQGELGK